MSFKTIVNWLFSDIWCYLVINCFDSKVVVFQQTVVRVYYIFKFQTRPKLLIIKSCKRGKSRGRTRNPVTSMMKFFLETNNNFQLLTIVTKNSVLDFVGIPALFVDSGQNVFTLHYLKIFPPHILPIPYVGPCKTWASIID